MRRLAEFLCRHHQDAEDVAHDALVKAVSHFSGFRSEATIRTWLHRIAANECAMLRRRKQAVSVDSLDLIDYSPAVSDPGEHPEEAAIAATQARALLSAIERLPERERNVLLLSAGAGLSAPDVAKASGLSVPAVRSLLFRARKRLRAAMADS